jgi:hypothetical protein
MSAAARSALSSVRVILGFISAVSVVSVQLVARPVKIDGSDNRMLSEVEQAVIDLERLVFKRGINA